MDVRELQQRLTTLGYRPGALDGQMGPRTIEAVKAFQTDQRLVADGVVGPKTLAALGGRQHGFENAPATVSPACVDLIKAWEGVADGNPQTVLLEPHHDRLGDVIDIGFGHVILGPDGKPFRPSKLGSYALKGAAAEISHLFGAPAITRDQAKALLAMDINAFVGGVMNVMSGGPRLDQGTFDALVSFAYNVGSDGLAGSTLRRRVFVGVRVTAGPLPFAELAKASRAGDASSGGLERAFGAWSKSGGQWTLGLFRRRMSEAMVCRGDAVDQALAIATGIQA
jgi:lysozyme